jgi:hypothetical protein
MSRGTNFPLLKVLPEVTLMKANMIVISSLCSKNKICITGKEKKISVLQNHGLNQPGMFQKARAWGRFHVWFGSLFARMIQGPYLFSPPTLLPKQEHFQSQNKPFSPLSPYSA